MASLKFCVRGNKHLHFKVLQIKINEKQTSLWVWRLYWKTGQGRNEYLFMVCKRASQWMPGYGKDLTHGIGQSSPRFPLYSALMLCQTTHVAQSKMVMKNDFFLSAYYHLIGPLLTTDPSKSLTTNHLHVLFHACPRRCITSWALKDISMCLVLSVPLVPTLFKGS